MLRLQAFASMPAAFILFNGGLVLEPVEVRAIIYLASLSWQKFHASKVSFVSRCTEFALVCHKKISVKACAIFINLNLLVT